MIERAPAERIMRALQNPFSRPFAYFAGTSFMNCRRGYFAGISFSV